MCQMQQIGPIQLNFCKNDESEKKIYILSIGPICELFTGYIYATKLGHRKPKIPPGIFILFYSFVLYFYTTPASYAKFNLFDAK